jgi:hypothetical protein
MTFVFPIVLGGLALLAVPVLIHLILRQKPRTLPFPAFRFLLQRHKTNLRKLRLRHLLLLALRMLLLAAACLALARPKILSESLRLNADSPVAAVLIFDTSYSMEYKVPGGVTRLEEAKKRGLELLDELPEGSRVAVLDTAENAPSSRGAWYLSPAQARDCIDGLRLRPANAPVTTRLENGYRLLADLAQSDDGRGRSLPRLLCVFSDRTRACWDGGRLARLQEAAEQVPPPLERLSKVRNHAPALIEFLQRLRTELPPKAGQDYPEQSVVNLWQELRDRIPSLTADDYPDRETSALLSRVRGKTRELHGILGALRDGVPEAAKEYHQKLVTTLTDRLDDLRGVHEVFVDVGVDEPVNLGLLALELSAEGDGLRQRQVFAPDEKVVLRAVVQAAGADFDTTVQCQVGGKSVPQPLALKAGEKRAVPFEIDCQDLAPGPHSVEVRLATPDPLPFDNKRYTTFAVRESRKVLILADEPDKATEWKRAIESQRKALFRATIRAADDVKELGPGELSQYQAVYLFNVADPPDSLWTALREYVDKGGGLAVVPGGEDLRVTAYADRSAQDVLPGRFLSVMTEKEPGVTWAWGDERIYQHPLLRKVREWRDSGDDDFITFPRLAVRSWDVKPGPAGVAVVRYADEKKRPALLERRLGAGRVLLFTTRLDTGQRPHWNNYLEHGTSFCVVLPWLATAYLAGDMDDPQMNFLAGEGVPQVRLTLAGRAPSYTLQGPGILETVPAPAGLNVLTLKQAIVAGNYAVEDPERNRVGAFSVNVPHEEGNLARVPTEEIEALFGRGALVPVGRGGRLSAALEGHWDQPLDLLPWLLVMLLVALALESLLGNLFYRREATEINEEPTPSAPPSAP